MDECLSTEVLVIGCGIAGGVAALELARAGIPVIVVTRVPEPGESNTWYAQGGIIHRGTDDSPALLVEDLLRAGAGHGNPRAIRILAEEGPDLVQSLLMDTIGVRFDRDPDGSPSLALEGGHSVPRIAHAADATGRAVENALLAALRSHPNVTLVTGCTAVDLLTPSHHSTNRLVVYDPQSCAGAYVLDQATGRISRCLARNTILATGGLGQIFLFTTNPPGARGDGVAMAYRAGARVINMEFVQFHPTTFYNPPAPSFLISEAVRGEGARLVDSSGEPFMQKYDPQWKDLAARDVVARGMHQEMLARGVRNVYLDLRSYIPAERVRAHFPNIYETCLRYDVDVTRDLVPVVPGAHYACGGIWVDEWGRTTIDRLHAVGEVSCTGVHGANRLASASLLEGLVWGRRAARDIAARRSDAPMPGPEEIPSWRSLAVEPPDPALIRQDMSTIKQIMWNYVGLVRTTPRLQRALRELRNLETEIEEFYRAARLTDGVVGLRNAVRTAVIVAAAAWENKTNLGCHYRE